MILRNKLVLDIERLLLYCSLEIVTDSDSNNVGSVQHVNKARTSRSCPAICVCVPH